MHFKVDIQADVKKVYNTMLDKDTFIQWTSVFNPSSDMVGNWEKGSRILFTGINDQGEKEGTIGVVKTNIVNEYVSIEYIGLIDGDREVTNGPEIRDWVGARENYSFEQKGEITTVAVDVDVTEDMLRYFSQTYAKALEKLKTICEL